MIPAKTDLLKSAAGFVLAGGQSARMGTDKALSLFTGLPLVQIALNTLAGVGVSARIAGSRSALGTFAEEIPDTFADAGPLGGVHAALSASSALMPSPAEWSLFLPVDMPLMPPSLLGCLLRRAILTGEPVTGIRLNGRLEPFPVLLHSVVLPLVTKRLQRGETACYKAWQTIPEELGTTLDAVPVELLLQCGQCQHSAGLPTVLWFQSANTPAELARLNQIGTRIPSPPS